MVAGADDEKDRSVTGGGSPGPAHGNPLFADADAAPEDATDEQSDDGDATAGLGGSSDADNQEPMPRG